MQRLMAWLVILLCPGLAQAFNPAVVFDTWKIDDGGYTESARAGVLAFEKFRQMPVAVITPGRQDVNPEVGFQEIIMTAVKQGYDPIICIGFSYESAVRNLAPRFPKTRFIIIDAIVSGSNVQSIIFREEEGAFLVGYLAGMATKTGKVGFVGGLDCELIRKFGCAFAQGVRHRDPDIDIYSVMVGDTVKAWIDPVRGAELARQLIADGVDVIFHAAGMTGDGVIQAAAEADILAIGVDSDQSRLAPGHVLTSMLKRMDVAVFLALSRVAGDDWRPGLLRLGLKEGAVDWAVNEYNIIMITPEMQDRMDSLTFDLQAGRLKAFIYRDPEPCPFLDFGPEPKASSKEQAHELR